MVVPNNTTSIGSSVLKCPVCGGENTIIEDPTTGALVCRACGTVIQERTIAIGPYWRVFGSGDVISKVSSKAIDFSLPNIGIGNSKISVAGSGSIVSKLRALAKRNRLIQYSDNTERKIAELRNLFMNIKYNRLNLPDTVIEEALTLYRQLSRRCDGIKGARTKDLALVLLYIACKRQRLGYQLRELKAALNVDKSKRVSKILTTIKQCLVDMNGGNVVLRSEEELGRFLDRVIGSLKLGEDVRYYVTKLSVSIVREGEKLKLMNGRTAYSLIASAVYIATTLMGARRRQRDIAEAARVTDVTIRNRYKEVLSKMDIVIDV